MEIFSYVLSGSLAHEDSLGNSRALQPGEIQLMRAGSGVRHSEFNPLASGPSHFLQVWITPHTRGLAPDYTEWKPDAGNGNTPKTLVISPDGREGSATIAQDAFIYLLKLDGTAETSHELAPGRGLWLHIAKGKAQVNGIKLEAGDAISLEQPGAISVSADGAPLEAILFDLA
jgi:redox-sensitive bicupin YhaK (pirin superfamily)